MLMDRANTAENIERCWLMRHAGGEKGEESFAWVLPAFLASSAVLPTPDEAAIAEREREPSASACQLTIIGVTRDG
jgi:hypothetical protein